MKGQIVIEFIVAVIVLIAVVFYIINSVNSSFFSFSRDSRTSFLESKALQISDALVGRGGVWEQEVPKQPGIGEEWPVLNTTKMGYLEQYCSDDYAGLLGRLDLEGNRIRISAETVDGAGVLGCGPQVPSGALNVKTRRYALNETLDIIILDLYIW